MLKAEKWNKAGLLVHSQPLSPGPWCDPRLNCLLRIKWGFCGSNQALSLHVKPKKVSYAVVATAAIPGMSGIHC